MYGNYDTKTFDHGYLGLAAGVSLQYNVTNIFSLQTDLLYERKGFAKTEEYVDNHLNTIRITNVKYYFDYVTIPVLTRLYIRSAKAQFFMNAGPFLGVYLKQTPNIPPPYRSDDQKMQPLDAGISVGLGLNIPIKNKFAFSVEARDNTGLLNISTIPLRDGGTIKTNSINLFVSFVYKIALAKKLNKGS
jgi:hypothetical protein